MKNRYAFLLASSVVLILVAVGIVAAQAPAKTVLDGVYTDEQAGRGEIEYARNCAGCHSADLVGAGAAPALRNLEFLDLWREDYLRSLFQYMRTRMPQGGREGKLREDQYVDILAHILKVNEFPSGPKELTVDDIDATFLVGLNGPQAMPANATIRTTGCLAHVGDNWNLTHATAPSRVRNGSETDGAEIAASSSAPLGVLAFRLTNLEDDHPAAELTAATGHKVQVKGVLNGRGVDARVYALSFKNLDLQCQP